MKLFKKFSLYFLLPLLVLLTLIGSIIYFPTAASLQEQVDKNLLATADTVNSEISERINVIKSDLTVMRTYREFDEYYSYLDFEQAEQADRRVTAIQDNFLKLGNLKPEYTAVRFYDAEGRALINVVDGRRSYIAIDVSDSQWFRRTLAMKEGEAYVSDVYTSSEYTEPMLTISQPIYYLGEIRGVIGIDSKVADIFGDLLTKKSIGEGGYAYLVGPSGKILVHRNSEMVNEDVSSLYSTKRIFEGYKGIISAKDERGAVQMRKVYMPLESTNIGLVVEMPTAKVFGPVLQMRNTVLPILIVGLALLIVTGFALVRKITTPIEELTDISNRMSTGNLGVKADVKSNDEIGELASAFNRMAESLKDRTGKLKESEEKYRALFENARDAIFITDIETEELLYVNRMAEKLTGRNRKELIGMHRLKLHPKDKAAYYKKLFRDRVDSGGAIDNEAEVERKDGTIVPVLISASVSEIGDKKIIQGIFRDITERKRAEDDMLRKFLRYRVKKGEVYLIKEQKPDLSIEVFKDILSCGFSGTVFSRAKKEEIEGALGKVNSFWFAENTKARDAIEPRFSEIESRIKALGAGNNAVLIDRVDYLVSKNGFDDTLKFVQRLFEQADYQMIIVILTLDPQTLRPSELRRLEKETKKVEPKVKSRLPEDIHEILKFVYSENRIGGYPSYKDVHEKFKITRTTARNRIKRLKSMKFLVDRKRGRTKVLEITDEGREQF